MSFNPFFRRTQRFIALCACTVQLLACANASGPRFSGIEAPQDGQAVVYVYRPERMVASGGYPRLQFNGYR